jgi:hypothetical protein
VGKYVNLETDIFSVFASTQWKSEKINTYPNNFTITNNSGEFIRVTIIPSGAGINIASASGVLIIDIFTFAGEGTKRSSTIADKLDQYLVGKSINTINNNNTQFQGSSLSFMGADTDNPSLFRSNYTISFNFYGAL